MVRVNDQEGTCQLSKKKLDGMKVWDEMATYCEEKTVIEGPLTEENEGGLGGQGRIGETRKLRKDKNGRVDGIVEKAK